jgi:mRNA-degrading endonuclease RelE of RelBE toxin-antitoxin system
MVVYRIRFAAGVERELRGIRAHDRARILDAIEEMLSREPSTEARNRKCLVTLLPPFETVPPVWELRVGDHRVFYDVSPEEETVYVRAVRRKPPHRTTEEIL